MGLVLQKKSKIDCSMLMVTEVSILVFLKSVVLSLVMSTSGHQTAEKMYYQTPEKLLDLLYTR